MADLFLKIIFWRNSKWIEYSAENAVRSGWKKKILDIVYSLTNKISDGFVCITEDAKKMHIDFGFPEQKLLVCPQLGIDEEAFSILDDNARKELRKNLLNVSNETIVIGYIGRFDYVKGIDLLLKAFLEVESITSKKLFFLMVGNGPMKNEVENWSKNKSNIVHLDALSHIELVKYFQTLDLFMLPSRMIFEKKYFFKEQLGHTLIEAMSCGVPCLGSTSGEIPNVIQNPDYVFEHSNQNSLNAALLNFINKQSISNLDKQEIRRSCVNRYSNKILAKRLADFIKKFNP